jgi:hypothetical protein
MRNSPRAPLSVRFVSAYRTHDDPREARRDRLARELARVREDRAHDRGEPAELRAEERRLLRSIRDLGMPGPRGASGRRVWALRIVSPCTEDWNAMVGDARVRHCSVCDRDVFDLAELTSAQVTSFLEARGEAPCVRMRRRADGTLVTADACPEPPRSRAVAVATVAVTATALTVGAALVAHEGRTHCARPAQVPITERHHDAFASTIMGELRSVPPSPPEPRPPWERTDIVEAGFEAVAHFTDDTPRDEPSSQ